MMNRSIRIVSFVILTVFITLTAATAWADAEALYTKMNKALTAAKSAAYNVSLQNRIKGQLKSAETLAVKTSDGRLYVKWTGKVNAGRELLLKPGWNNGRLWVKEGGALEYSAVSVAFDDPVVRADYIRALDVLLPEKLAALLAEWKQTGTAAQGADANSFTIARGDAGVVEVSLDAAGYPVKITVKDGKGQVAEDYRLSNIKVPAAFTDSDFDVANPNYGFPGYSPDGIAIDAERMKASMARMFGASGNYTCRLDKRERIDGKMQETQHIDVKFRKPGHMYLKWAKGPHEGRQMLYRAGTDDKLFVKEAGLLGIATVRLSPDSSMVKADTNHPLLDLDLGFTINLIYDNLSKGQKNGDVKLKFKGIEWVGGRPAYVVESTFTKVAEKGYYAPRSLNYHDRQTGLPVRTIIYEADGSVREEYSWTKLKMNAGLTDKDFDPENPEYGF